MIRQIFNVESYWKVIVYYNVDYNLFYFITQKLLDAGASDDEILEIFNTMRDRKAKAVTYSNTKKHISIVLFNIHHSKEDYINSIVHEAEHIKQAMLYAYNVEDKGEPPAYTIGYLVMRMWKMFSRFK